MDRTFVCLCVSVCLFCVCAEKKKALIRMSAFFNRVGIDPSKSVTDILQESLTTCLWPTERVAIQSQAPRVFRADPICTFGFGSACTGSTCGKSFDSSLLESSCELVDVTAEINLPGCKVWDSSKGVASAFALRRLGSAPADLPQIPECRTKRVLRTDRWF